MIDLLLKRRPAFAGLIMLSLLCSGPLCLEPSSADAQEVQSGYGRQRGRKFGNSVNGTSALAELFRIKGHKVTTWTKLSPRIEEFDTILWFPDNFDPPSQAEIDRLNSWMSAGFDRTLIYVGRDYDAEIDYWQRMLVSASATDKPIMRRRLAQARIRHSTMLNESDRQAACDWFKLDGSMPGKRITSVAGEWFEKINATAVDLHSDTRLIPILDNANEYHVIESRELLVSGKDPIATEVTDSYYGYESRLILINNGSFLLNLPLVDAGNRELAGQLVNEISNNGDVLFLESGPDGIPIRESEDSGNSRRATEWMNIWPLNLMIGHALVIGIIFLFTYSPTFGRPRKVLDDSASDFGKHIDSLGQLVRTTGDEQYALSRLKHYQEHVKGQQQGVST